jgi:hypothetical protein
VFLSRFRASRGAARRQMRHCGEFFAGAQLITRPPEQKLFGPVCRPRDHLFVVDPGLGEGRGFSSVALFASSARHRANRHPDHLSQGRS